MESRVRQGYLIIGDISGYTAFFAETELAHAQEIMEELIKIVLRHVKPPFNFVKLEGDAVFFYADGAAFLDGSRVIEAIEACYFDFSDHLVNSHRSTTCQCNACRAMPTLDLKFFVHYGEYVIQKMAGVHTDLASSDVIVLHRLTKNHVSENTGLKAYLLLTEACLKKIGTTLPLLRQVESYEHIGEIGVGIHDLKTAWKRNVDARRVFVTPDQADIIVESILPAAPSVVWDYLVDPVKTVQWLDIRDQRNELADGRLQVGATLHCIHNDNSTSFRKFLDWRPFHYFTTRDEKTSKGFSPQAPPAPMLLTWELAPVDDLRTRLMLRFRLVERTILVAVVNAFLKDVIIKAFVARFDRLSKMLPRTEQGDVSVNTRSAP
jgi:uncharacterized protein YndB with AHSA1/START domain